MKVVIRFQGTKYSETRVGRVTFHAVFNNVSVQRRILSEFDEHNDLMNTFNAHETPMINLCDVTSESGTLYDTQQFTLRNQWDFQRLIRGQVIIFKATIYRLTKLKSKNAQKSGPSEIVELRYPDDIQHDQNMDKRRLKPKVKDTIVDYRESQDRGRALHKLIDEQVKDLEAEHNYLAIAASRKAQKDVRKPRIPRG